MNALIQFIRQHPDIVIRKVSADCVLLAAPATVHGNACSDLSPALRSFKEVREWLGY
jgi:hypothetical protein